MHKKLLPLTLIASLIGSSCAAMTEEQKISQFYEIEKKAVEAATQEYPDRGLGTATLVGITATIASFIPASITVIFLGDIMKIQKRMLVLGSGAATFSLAALCSIYGYKSWQQSRANKKSNLITQHLVTYFATHQDELPSEYVAAFEPLIAKYNAQKKSEVLNRLTPRSKE